MKLFAAYDDPDTVIGIDKAGRPIVAPRHNSRPLAKSTSFKALVDQMNDRAMRQHYDED